jgi:UDP-3-O-[3-hydroxymyristoyl] glucosamine N-acyltransferase
MLFRRGGYAVRIIELAEWLGATFEGDGEREVTGVANLETAGAADVAFATGRKGVEQAATSAAGCLLVPPTFENPGGRTVIRVPDPRLAFARVVNLFHPRPQPVPGIDGTAVVASTADIGANVAIGPRATVGEGTRIGAGTVIGAGCAIGNNVNVGRGCILHANVTLYDNVDIGNNVLLHSGCVIGADGFGFVMAGDHYEKFPQVGRVVIEDDVEIGANSCVDRAALGVTWIGQGSKFDNMVHVAHNCRIGRHVVVAAQTGFSGSVVVEDYAVIGGQVGIGDKARIESRAVLGSGCGVLTSKVIRAGQVVWGTPARPLKQYLETLANMSRLPEVRKDVRELRQRVQRLEGERT